MSCIEVRRGDSFGGVVDVTQEGGGIVDMSQYAFACEVRSKLTDELIDELQVEERQAEQQLLLYGADTSDWPLDEELIIDMKIEYLGTFAHTQLTSIRVLRTATK